MADPRLIQSGITKKTSNSEADPKSLLKIKNMQVEGLQMVSKKIGLLIIQCRLQEPTGRTCEPIAVLGWTGWTPSKPRADADL